MRYLIAALCWTMLLGLARADAPRDAPSVATTIDRGVAFLAKDAVAWRTEYKCISCHHASLIVMAMREAKQRGITVDEPVLAELTKWLAEAGDGKTGVPRPEEIPKAFNEKAVSLALAVGTDPQPDEATRAEMKLLLNTIKGDQTENGSWASWPETRPPLFGHSDERATASAVLALHSAAAAGDDSTRAARDKGIAWLTATKSDEDPQSVALRLILWRRLDRPADEWQPLVKRIRERQNADGGWSQAPEMASDAWATGQALYALGEAATPADDSAIRRGHEFLGRTQRDDGSWPMTSRPTKPGGEGSSNLVPIIGGGTRGPSWASCEVADSPHE